MLAKDYRKVAEVRDFSSRSIIEVPSEGLDRVNICLAKIDGKYFALSNICTHKGGPMNEGTVGKDHLICPWHKAYFRLKDGKCSLPAERALRVFEVKVEEDGSIYIKVREKGQAL